MSLTRLPHARFFGIWLFCGQARLDEELAKCSEFFDGCTDEVGRDFRSLHFAFCGLLYPANLPTDAAWFTRARLWRLILTQHHDGHWELSDDLAGAVLSQVPAREDDDSEAAEDEGDPLRTNAACLAAAMPKGLQATCAEAGVSAGSFWATALAVEALRRMPVSWLAEEESPPRTIVDTAQAWLDAKGLEVWGTPQEVLSAAAASDGLGALIMTSWRSWVLSASALDTQSDAGNADDGSPSAGANAGGDDGGLRGGSGGNEGELGDGGSRAQPAQQVAGSQTAAVLQSRGHVRSGQSIELRATTMAAARNFVASWDRAFLQRVKAMRRVETSSLHGIFSALQRAAGEVCLSFLVKHETASVFLSPVALELPRWQAFMCLVTMLVSLLVTDIWFFYSKSKNCCIEIRSLLDDGTGTVCPPTVFTASCRGFVGNCADISLQFAGVESALPDDYECHQFPDDSSGRDKLVVGLICAAVSVPFTYVLVEAFAKSNEPEFPECQLSWPARFRFVRPVEHWDWTVSRPGPVRVMMARWAHEGLGKICFELCLAHVVEPGLETLGNAAQYALHAVRWHSGQRGAFTSSWVTADDAAGARRAGGSLRVGGADAESGDEEERALLLAEAEEGTDPELLNSQERGRGVDNADLDDEAVNDGEDDGAALRSRRTRLRRAGVGMVYASWAIMVWIIFVYGAS